MIFIFYIQMALAATLFTWFVTALGAATVIFLKSNKEALQTIMLGFAAGVMIAASFWSLLQPAAEMAANMSNFPAWFVLTSGFTAGALFIWLSDKTLSAFQKRNSKKNFSSYQNNANSKLKRVYMLILSITLHNIPEGLAVGVAFGAIANGEFSNERLMGAISVAVGIAIQNFPEGAAVALPLRREGFSRMKCFFWGQISGIVEPVAGVLGAALVVHMTTILPFALAFAAGAMIIVSVHELIPESQNKNNSKPYIATMGIIGGFTAMMLLDVMLG